MNLSLSWAPSLTMFWVSFVAALAVLALLIAVFGRGRDFIWRGIFLTVVVILFMNPVVLHQVRQALNDKLVIVVDDSASEKIGGRDKVAEQALAYIQSKLKAPGAPEPIIVRASDVHEGSSADGTRLFTALRNRLLDIPLQQVAGTVLITDGQVHDVPAELGVFERLAPFHVVLTGRKDEFDRKITILSAPKYGLLKDDVSIKIRYDQYGKGDTGQVMIDALQDGQKQSDVALSPGGEYEFTFKLLHPGQNVFQFRVPAAEGELTTANNTAPVIINGVRDRLKVLLVSGRPHMGERAWRNLLKSDPGIDLVHFTILRSPLSRDPTPPRELSLIVFPVDELFNKKINDFDLIIFDKYEQFSLLQPSYFANIRSFIRNGGAFLLAMGGDAALADTQTVFDTALSDTLPVAPVEPAFPPQAYTPLLTDEGKKHPLTADLAQTKKWGQWYTQAHLNATSGQTLMTGTQGQPLLVIDKVGDGRVAALASDNIWFWSKGGAAQGPYTPLLRNLAHWLMKEPELEDDYLKAEARGNEITISQRDATAAARSVTMTTPAGKEQKIDLPAMARGWATGQVAAEEEGVYAFTSGTQKAFAVVGTAQNLEYADVHTTPDILKPVVDSTGGAIVWFQDQPDFELRDVSTGATRKGGDDWIGMKRNEAFAVSHVEAKDLIDNWLFLFVFMVGMVGVWVLESGIRKTGKQVK